MSRRPWQAPAMAAGSPTAILSSEDRRVVGRCLAAMGGMSSVSLVGVAFSLYLTSAGEEGNKQEQLEPGQAHDGLMVVVMETCRNAGIDPDMCKPAPRATGTCMSGRRGYALWVETRWRCESV